MTRFSEILPLEIFNLVLYPLAEILDKMAAALAHFVHNGVQIISETVWKFIKFLKYNNQELMVPSTLDRDIFNTDSAIHQTSQGLDK